MPTPRAGGSEGAGPALPSAAPGRRPLILVVEDDPDCRTIYRMILLATGYGVLETGNGTEALWLARRYVPDAILMDLGVPGTDGWSATRSLRQRPETEAIPVIVLSGHVLPEHRARARAAGCAAFLTKPIAPTEVVAEIRRVLRSAGDAGPAPRG